MSIAGGSQTRTIALRTIVVALAFAVPMIFGVWDRVLAPFDDRPTPTVTSGQRLLLPDFGVPNDPSYSFIARQPGSADPVAFDPCRPIHYVVNDAGAPPGSGELLAESIDRISRATGLQFSDAGTTTEPPSSGRPSFQPDRYGDRWSPVLIAWSTAAQFDDLAGPVIGVASNAPVDAGDGQLAYVSGQVVLDAEQLGDLLKYNGGRSLTVAAITHELGHLVGLGHVNDDRQLMYPSARPLVTSLGQGDLSGLAVLGNGQCFDSL